MNKTIIIGAGFAGLEAAKQLACAKTEVTLFDKTNYHLFQPLLYQVATAALSPVDIAVPVRQILKHQKNLTFLMGEVTAIDKEGQTVIVDNTTSYSFDSLVVAPGARHSYFGNPQWEVNAPGLKTLSDAISIRTKILTAFEQAERAPDRETAKKYLRFVVIGGGPTGVELAGAIAEIAFHTLIHDFKNFRSSDAEIHLVEASSQLLPGFPSRLSQIAARDLEKLGVNVLLNFPVTDVSAQGIRSNQHFLETQNVVWAAGNQASPLVQTLGLPLDRQHRVIVEKDLSLPGFPNIFVVGDAACAKSLNGRPYPALAPVAKQQGQYVAKIIRNSLKKHQRTPFHYTDKGSLATIGKGKAVGTIGKLKVRGFFAWLTWSIIHIFYLVGFRNRLFVVSQWMFWYFRGKRRVQLIIPKS